MNLGYSVHQFYADKVYSRRTTSSADLLLTFVLADEFALEVVDFNTYDSFTADGRQNSAIHADTYKLLRLLVCGIVDSGNLAFGETLEEKRNGDVAGFAVEYSVWYIYLYLVLAGLNFSEYNQSVVYNVARAPVAE